MWRAAPVTDHHVDPEGCRHRLWAGRSCVVTQLVTIDISRSRRCLTCRDVGPDSTWGARVLQMVDVGEWGSGPCVRGDA